jgi:Cu(I)/Ag(I) efflux system membrane fusion protein
MSLADLSSVWLIAEVFESQADWVKVGQTAEVSLAFLPGRIWEGTVEYIYPSLDAKTRTLKARLRFDNPDEALKPNMYANVRIFGGARDDTIVIPVEALIRTGRESRVVMALGEGRFASRTVTAGIESGDQVEIIAGLEPGEEVVTSGQFLIDSEASLKASMTRMQASDNADEQDVPK